MFTPDGEPRGYIRPDKLKELCIPEEQWLVFTDLAVDIMYEKFYHANQIKSKEEEGLLYLLNEILGKLGLNYIKEINDFKLDRPVILTLNGEDYIN